MYNLGGFVFSQRMGFYDMQKICFNLLAYNRKILSYVRYKCVTITVRLLVVLQPHPELQPSLAKKQFCQLKKSWKLYQRLVAWFYGVFLGFFFFDFMSWSEGGVCACAIELVRRQGTTSLWSQFFLSPLHGFQGPN